MVLYIWVTSLIQAILSMVGFSIKCKLPLMNSQIKSVIIGSVTALFVQIIHKGIITLSYFTALICEWGLILIGIILCVIFLFYRDPERMTTKKENIILSPADGMVRYVKKVTKGKIPFSNKKGNQLRIDELAKCDLLKNGLYLIGIEMNIFDVHVNRAPIGGKIVYQENHKGKYLSLRNIRSAWENERVTTVIDSGHFIIGVIQIASRLVRRIVSYLPKGSEVKIGQRFGTIKFGSQVDVVIPALHGLQIKVKKGQRVQAGTSIIAQYDRAILGRGNPQIKKNLRVILLAYPDNPIGQIFLKSFIKNNIFLSGIILEKKNRKNNWIRYKKKIQKDGIGMTIKRVLQIYWLRYTKQDIQNIARKNNIPQYRVERFNSQACEDLLSSLDIDLLAIASAPILKENIFQKAKIGCLNAHPGLLPKYRGIGANAYAVQNGDSPGVTVHFIDKDIDKGKIVIREKVSIKPGDTIQKINDRAVSKGALLMSDVIHMIQEDKLVIPEIDEPYGNMYYAMPYSEVKKINKQLKREIVKTNAI